MLRRPGTLARLARRLSLLALAGRTLSAHPGNGSWRPLRRLYLCHKPSQSAGHAPSLSGAEDFDRALGQGPDVVYTFLEPSLQPGADLGGDRSGAELWGEGVFARPFSAEALSPAPDFHAFAPEGASFAVPWPMPPPEQAADSARWLCAAQGEATAPCFDLVYDSMCFMDPAIQAGAEALAAASLKDTGRFVTRDEQTFEAYCLSGLGSASVERYQYPCLS